MLRDTMHSSRKSKKSGQNMKAFFNLAETWYTKPVEVVDNKYKVKNYKNNMFKIFIESIKYYIKK